MVIVELTEQERDYLSQSLDYAIELFRRQYPTPSDSEKPPIEKLYQSVRAKLWAERFSKNEDH